MGKIPKFGKTTDTIVLDENGSTMKESTNYQKGLPIYPKRRDYEYRHRCDKTDLATISKIAADLFSDESKLDAHIKFDKTTRDGKKYYYVIECYSKLVY